MSQRRKNRSSTPSAGTPAAAPAPVVEASTPAETDPPAKPGKTPLFWRFFGGAAVAAVAVVGVAIYQQMQSQVNTQRRELSTLNNDLRRDLTQVGGSYTEMINKEDHGNRLRTIWDTLKELRADRGDLSMMKERCSLLMEMYKAAEEDRRNLASEVRKLRESKAAGDERDALSREIRALRERISQFESTPKPKVISAGHEEP